MEKDERPIHESEPAAEEAGGIEPDLLPEDAPRGAATIPDATHTGTMTPPITGWGETLSGEERPRDVPPPED